MRNELSERTVNGNINLIHTSMSAFELILLLLFFRLLKRGCLSQPVCMCFDGFFFGRFCICIGLGLCSPTAMSSSCCSHSLCRRFLCARFVRDGLAMTLLRVEDAKTKKNVIIRLKRQVLISAVSIARHV